MPGMDPRPFCRLERVGGDLDIFRDCAGKAAHDDRIAHFFADLPHALEISRARHGKPRLDNIHAEPDKLSRDLDLFRRIHARARGLFPVAERRVEYLYDAAHVLLPVLYR